MRARLGIVCSAALFALSPSLAPALASTARPFAVKRVTTEGVVHLSFDSAALSVLTDEPALVLADVPLAPGVELDLSLTRAHAFSPDARIVVMTDEGEELLARPDSRLFTGTVAGDADSLAVLSLSPGRVQGLVVGNDETFILSSGPATGAGELVAFGMERIPDDLIDWANFTCHADQLAQLPTLMREGDGGLVGPQADTDCRLIPLALETDRQYLRDLFDDDTGDATAYAELLVGATSEIYKRDFNARYEIVYLRLWDSSDPWNQGDSVNQLYQFQDYWDNNMNHIERALAHFLSARSLGGGVAWVGVVCHDEYGYALSGNLAGYFPYPIQDNSPQNWDLMVFAHEGGHNVGSPHTHDMNPPVDGCAWGDCTTAPNGTIMSYCHLCDGGMANILMEFHPRSVDEAIVPYFENYVFCDLSEEAPQITDQPAGGSVCVGASLELSVTANGVDLTYQWRKDSVDIFGATASTYLIDPADPSDAGDYDVVVSNGCEAATSETAGVDVYTLAADLDGDGVVGQEDLGILLAAYGDNDGGDVDGDGDTDQSDLGVLLAHYGDSCD